MEVDYDFCRNSKLTLKDLLIWLDLDSVFDEDMLYAYDVFGRNFMVVGEALRISCRVKDFDRWANSEEYWLDITKRSDKRFLIEWVEEQRVEHLWNT